MDYFDPTAEEVEPLQAKEGGWRVEEVAQLQASDPGSPDGAVSKAHAPEVSSTAASVQAAPVAQTMNNVSGRYRGRVGSWELELRVDVDGWWPMQKVSGDFFWHGGGTKSYFGSFHTTNTQLSVTATHVIIEGDAQKTWSGSPRFRVTIQRTNSGTTFAPAHAQFVTASGQRQRLYVCNFESSHFRTILYERDVVAGTTPFLSYNTGSLKSGGLQRDLWVTKAFWEHGIEMVYSGDENYIPIGGAAGAGSNALWSNSEMHKAMEAHFASFASRPQTDWKLWLLAAGRHENSGLLGIMFDYQGQKPHRQGAAVFHDHPMMQGTSNVAKRYQLWCYIHELGHAFNLVHSVDKNPARLGALSFMNYPWVYQPDTGPSGEAAFWDRFRFLFDYQEVTHMRHGFRNNVIMGGSDWDSGSAIEAPSGFSEIVEDNSGLRLQLRSRSSFALGEPVVVEIKLSTTDLRGKEVHASLHPNDGFVQLAIQKPGGEVMHYHGLMTHCADAKRLVLDAERPAAYESAYIGYGRNGFHFDQPGSYKIMALYNAFDGSEVISNTLIVRVRAPFDAASDEVADLFLGDDQGKLLTLLGSDAETLKSGNDAFDLILDKYASHPLAVYAQMVKGVNASREFKTITPEKKLVVRKADHAKSVEMLSSVVEASQSDGGVDNITLNMTMRRIAQTQKSMGDKKSAQATMKRMVDLFRNKALKPHVIKQIEMQAKEALQ